MVQKMNTFSFREIRESLMANKGEPVQKTNKSKENKRIKQAILFRIKSPHHLIGR
jgi:hypothetical protein